MSKELSRRRSSGYTMIELIMVIVIVAILASVAIPSFRYVTNSNRISSEVNGLLGDLQFARSEAVKEGQPVTVCAASGPSYTGCSGSSNWAAGWIVFLDTNGDQVHQNSEAIVRTQPALGGTDTFIATPGTFNAITYNRMGYAPTLVATSVNITLHDSTWSTNWTRCVAINPIGTAVTEKNGVGTPACN
jgi:type IV fimbrial biogenesis protein FimT